VSPTPAAELWNGTTGLDPAFVGEFLNSLGANAPPQSTANPAIPLPTEAAVDWRLLPGAPFLDIGVPSTGFSTPYAFQANSYHNYPLANCPELSPLTYDHEFYGNPRIVSTGVDIGWDEVHGLISAGSWSNYSISHHGPSELLPALPAKGGTRRYFIWDETVLGSNLRVNGVIEQPDADQASPVYSWWRPVPGALQAPIEWPGATFDYRRQYIPLNNPSPTPTQWLDGGVKTTYRPMWVLGQTSISVRASASPAAPPTINDLESTVLPGLAQWFAIQAVRENSQSVPIALSNLQFEYR
jgi:hypothetical protein